MGISGISFSTSWCLLLAHFISLSVTRLWSRIKYSICSRAPPTWGSMIAFCRWGAGMSCKVVVDSQQGFASRCLRWMAVFSRNSVAISSPTLWNQRDGATGSYSLLRLVLAHIALVSCSSCCCCFSGDWSCFVGWENICHRYILHSEEEYDRSSNTGKATRRRKRRRWLWSRTKSCPNWFLVKVCSRR